MPARPGQLGTLQTGAVHPPRDKYREGRLRDGNLSDRRGGHRVGTLQEPVHGRLSGAEDGDVSVVRAQPQFCRANVTGEPAAVRAGRDPILAALQDQDWRTHLPGVKAPRGEYARSSSTIPPRPPSMARPEITPSQCHGPFS